MSKTFALFMRMSPYLAEKARNLIDAMLLSTEEIGWDSQQQLIVNGRVYHDTDIVRLIAYIMSPANSISVKPIGLQVFISALRKIGLESDYVINQNVKRFLRKNNQSNNDDTEPTDHDSEDEKEYETSDYNDSNLDEEEAMKLWMILIIQMTMMIAVMRMMIVTAMLKMMMMMVILMVRLILIVRRRMKISGRQNFQLSAGAIFAA